LPGCTFAQKYYNPEGIFRQVMSRQTSDGCQCPGGRIVYLRFPNRDCGFLWSLLNLISAKDVLIDNTILSRSQVKRTVLASPLTSQVSNHFISSEEAVCSSRQNVIIIENIIPSLYSNISTICLPGQTTSHMAAELFDIIIHADHQFLGG
jgi:hypothetical protein